MYLILFRFDIGTTLLPVFCGERRRKDPSRSRIESLYHYTREHTISLIMSMSQNCFNLNYRFAGIKNNRGLHFDITTDISSGVSQANSGNFSMSFWNRQLYYTAERTGNRNVIINDVVEDRTCLSFLCQREKAWDFMARQTTQRCGIRVCGNESNSDSHVVANLGERWSYIICAIVSTTVPSTAILTDTWGISTLQFESVVPGRR